MADQALEEQVGKKGSFFLPWMLQQGQINPTFTRRPVEAEQHDRRKVFHWACTGFAHYTTSCAVSSAALINEDELAAHVE